MDNRDRQKKRIGTLILIFATFFWCYVAAWLNYIKPFWELTKLVGDNPEFHIFSELDLVKTIVIKFAILTFLSVVMYIVGIKLVKKK